MMMPQLTVYDCSCHFGEDGRQHPEYRTGSKAVVQASLIVTPHIDPKNTSHTGASMSDKARGASWLPLFLILAFMVLMIGGCIAMEYQERKTKKRDEQQYNDNENDWVSAIERAKTHMIADEAFGRLQEGMDHYHAAVRRQRQLRDVRSSKHLQRQGDLSYELGYWDGAARAKLEDVDDGVLVERLDCEEKLLNT